MSVRDNIDKKSKDNFSRHSAIQVELEEIIKELKELKQIAFDLQTELLGDWEVANAYGAEGAYDEAIERCERLMAEVTGVHPAT